MSWVKVEEVPGGQVVFCKLCGKRAFPRRLYRAADTNYAEALRLATAKAWDHEHSEIHAAGLAAFHSSEKPIEDEAEVLLRKIFGKAVGRTEKEFRRNAAKRAAESVCKTLRGEQ